MSSQASPSPLKIHCCILPSSNQAKSAKTHRLFYWTHHLLRKTCTLSCCDGPTHLEKFYQNKDLSRQQWPPSNLPNLVPIASGKNHGEGVSKRIKHTPRNRLRGTILTHSNWERTIDVNRLRHKSCRVLAQLMLGGVRSSDLRKSVRA